MSIRTLTTSTAYENPWFSVRDDEVELADGSRRTFSVVDRDDFAVVIPYERDGFHLVEQYRYATEQRSWEFPSGSFPPGLSGTAEEMARSELREETGLTAGRLERLGYLHAANGTMRQGFDVFLATELTPGPTAREQTEQDMRQQWFARADLEAMIKDGTLTCGNTLAAYALLRVLWDADRPGSVLA
jgi:8-oxo-dGTP pyrophosphatase MutT (NUDIX family)